MMRNSPQVLVLLVVMMVTLGVVGVNGKEKNGVMAKLSGDQGIPLVGIGVGNLQHDLIPQVVKRGLSSGYRLIDTAQASRNEALVRQAIVSSGVAAVAAASSAPLRGTVRGSSSGGSGGGGGNSEAATSSVDTKKVVVHVVTKIWYTHLGYERTKLAIAESLRQLGGGDRDKNGGDNDESDLYDIRIHLLLHWPRCDDKRISWMDCTGEERRLPRHVKDAGPPPHENPNAWQDSWRALEEAYMSRHTTTTTKAGAARLESIGVSNFEKADLTQLFRQCWIPPHLYQGNVWKVVHDPHVMDLLHKHKVHFQAYNVMNGVVQRRDAAPNAYAQVQVLGEALAKRAAPSDLDDNDDDDSTFTVGTAVLAWLVQQEISVIPRASNSAHQDGNAPASLLRVPSLTEQEKTDMKKLVSALMQGRDLPGNAAQNKAPPPDGVVATFFNALGHSPVQVFWSHAETGEEIKVMDAVHPGETHELRTHPGHKFVVYDKSRSYRKEFQVQANYGEHEHFEVSDEL